MNPVFANGNQRTTQRLIALRRQAIHDNAARVAQRLHAIILSLEGRATTEIAGLLKVHRSTVPLWIEQYNRDREEGLLEGHRSGRPSQLTPRQRQQLQDILDSGPVSCGLDTGVWTSPIIGEVIAQEWEVRFHPGHVRKLLRQLGYSVQRPTTKLVQADPIQKKRWVRYRYPHIKKKPAPNKR